MSKLLPAPEYDTIIEPFAGSAGYSTLYHTRNVILNDSDPVIAGVWDYLIHVSKEEFLRLPILYDVDQLPSWVPEEAKNLMGYWYQAGRPTPRKRATWARRLERPNSCWGVSVREQLANQLKNIRHWKVTCGQYGSVPNTEATWLIDPPYNNKAGTAYSHWAVDYLDLSRYARNRQGQVIVHEQEGAQWLPFVPLKEILPTASRVYGKKAYTEMVWANTQHPLDEA